MALSSRTDPYDLYDTFEDDVMACNPPVPVPVLPASQPAWACKPPSVPSGGANCHRRCILLSLIFYFERHVTVGHFT